jgi:hypothetical protein
MSKHPLQSCYDRLPPTNCPRPLRFLLLLVVPTANFLLESTIERLHHRLEYADRDIGKLIEPIPQDLAEW